MGSFNILTTEVECTNCGVKSPVRIQFKFGNTWQLQYKIGDTITWGGNDIGDPALTNVKAYGIAESTICPSCKEDCIPEYDVFIKDNVITGADPIKNIEDYLAGNAEYVVLNGS